MQYFLLGLKNFAKFSGRSRRKEYWMFVLFQLIFAIAAMLLDNLLGTTMGGVGGPGYIYMAYSFAMILPGLALAVRRMHDVNKSGLFLLVGLVPIIGGIWILILACTEGTRGPNQYGEDPKGQEVPAY
ncbi:DUF805 domain-containing protein [Hymenobacter lutimineralis]|uniref:DUF805 domain-containing protein n=1 Tax=Hymenobacter lutimineralis TaxID=2606448 RepID=A0A5D6V0K2_9BACT|nr:MULTISPECIES: DUF805 domain-containing protein [Hymenobacter]QIX61776.1 DUF805 domain-containing protein [Hymenobacter sp. BT18]TYZ09323.1 DUF805 domain-containing protein [Hymenobacter lutimineralis]